MKKSMKKIVALLLVVITCFSIAACAHAPSWDGKWKISEDDYKDAKIAKVVSSQNNGTRYVTLSNENINFKSDIKSDNIRVVAYPVSKASIESMSTADTAESIKDLLKETIIDDVSVERRDDNTLALSFKEPEYDYGCMYLFYVHKEAVESNEFVVGCDKISLEEGNSPKATITTNLKNWHENPTLELKLTNAKAADNIKSEDISLSGAFEDLKVTSVTSASDTITIKTEGKVKESSSAYGYVELSANATDAETKIIAMTEVDCLNAYVDVKSFKLEKGLLSFDVDIFGEKIGVSNDELASLVSLDGYKIDSVKISDDKSSFRLYVKTDSSSLDDEVNALNGKEIKIDSKAVGNAISVDISASCASLGGVIKSLDKPEGDSDKFKATAHIFGRNGELKELSKSDIKFSGDFEGAEVTSVKNTDNCCDIEFTFSADKDKALFNGYVDISDGKLIDLWGTKSEHNSSGLSYSFETNRADEDAIDTLVKKFENYSSKSLIDDIVSAADVIHSASISDFYSGKFVGAIFSLLGIRKSSDGKTAQILSIVTDIKTMVNNLDCELKDLKSTVQEYGDDILSEAKKNTLLALESKWSAFNTNYVEKLDKTVNSFNSDCDRSLVNYIKSEHGDELKLYYDTDGKLAVPDKDNTSFSVDAKRIDKSKTVTIKLDDDTFNNCYDVFSKKGFKYCDELIDALEKDLGNAVKKMNENGDKSIEYNDNTGEIIYGYLYLQMLFKNLTNDYMNNIRNDYENFCSQIYDGQKILETFDEMMKYEFNFQSEAKQNIENIRKSLVVMLYNYGITASFVEKYDTSLDKNDITEAEHKAIDYIKNNSGLYNERKGYSYCYVVNRPITLRVSGVDYKMKINTFGKTGQGPRPGIVDPRTSMWGYSGYEDLGTDAYIYKSVAGLDGERFGYVISREKGDLDSEEKTNVLSNNILSSKDLKILKARFNSLQASGRMPSYKNMTFGEYMTNGTAVKAEQKYMVHQIKVEDVLGGKAVKPTKILTSGVLNKEFPLDGSRTLICNKDGLADGFKIETGKYLDEYKYGGGHYYKPGEKYRMSMSSEYVHIHKEYDATVYDINANSMEENYVVLQAALYGESHTYWWCDEGAYFYNTNYQEPYFIFPIA